jgi:hypothetical protein
LRQGLAYVAQANLELSSLLLSLPSAGITGMGLMIGWYYFHVNFDLL